jgi:hypothetical protein
LEESQLPSYLNVIHSRPFTLQVLQNDDVLSDLTLFENQIPIFIVHVLSKTLFPYFSEQDSKETETLFNNLALSILGYSQLSQDKSLEIKLHHLLDVVHSSVNNSSSNNNNNNPEHVIDIMPNSTETKHVKVMTKLKLKRCATRLEAAGVIIQPVQDKGVRGLDFEFKFKDGKLEIAALIITKTTKAKWRNVIAWEHHKMDWKKSYSKGTNESEIYNTCGKFTSAALIFNDLICCTDDVKFLKDKNIIVDHTKMSNKELEEFIRTMSFGVDHGIVGYHVEMVDRLNDYTTVNPFIRFLKKLGHYFTYCLEVFIKFMKKEYHFVATVLSLCTIVQTVYTIIAYHLPK